LKPVFLEARETGKKNKKFEKERKKKIEKNLGKKKKGRGVKGFAEKPRAFHENGFRFFAYLWMVAAF